MNGYVAGLNDTARHAEATASFLSLLNPDMAYISVPTRPPAETRVKPPDGEALVRYHDIFDARVGSVEYLMGYEGSTFSSAGEPRENLLGITAVHPMRAEAVESLLERAGATWKLVEELLREGILEEANYAGQRYYLRRPRHQG